MVSAYVSSVFRISSQAVRGSLAPSPVIAFFRHRGCLLTFHGTIAKSSNLKVELDFVEGRCRRSACWMKQDVYSRRTLARQVGLPKVVEAPSVKVWRR